jgi:nucleoside-diphosphate-sugar epimerase
MAAATATRRYTYGTGLGLKVLLTGAAGFLGSHLARRMVREGVQVTALVRARSDLRRLADVRAGIELAEGDLFDPGSLETVVQACKPDVCVHLAWYVDRDQSRSLRNLDYVSASMRLLQFLDSAGCRRTVVAGTCLEQDTAAGYLSESTPSAPQNLYAACKHALHVMAEAFQKRQGRTLGWARLFNFYGPWDNDWPLIPDVIRTLLEGHPCDLTLGTQIRDFMYVEDMAAALWALARTDVDGAFNVGSSRPVTVAAVASLIGKLLGREDLLRFGARPFSPFDCRFCCANNEKLKAATGWAPQVDLEAGLSSTIEWWKSRMQM